MALTDLGNVTGGEHGQQGGPQKYGTYASSQLAGKDRSDYV